MIYDRIQKITQRFRLNTRLLLSEKPIFTGYRQFFL